VYCLESYKIDGGFGKKITTHTIIKCAVSKATRLMEVLEKNNYTHSHKVYCLKSHKIVGGFGKK
jgi:hypothetical protein